MHAIFFITVVTPDFRTSILAGFVIFAAIGNIAYASGDKVEDIAAEGVDLIFVVYPLVFTIFGKWGSPLSAAFFLVIFLLGFDTMFAMVESIASVVIEQLNWSRKKAVVIVVTILAALSIPTTFECGIYYFKLMDSYTCVIALMVVATFEICSISWYFGAFKFFRKLQEITGTAAPWIFKIIMVLLNPVIVIAITVATFMTSVISSAIVRENGPNLSIEDKRIWKRTIHEFYGRL